MVSQCDQVKANVIEIASIYLFFGMKIVAPF